jgi:competence protein ComEA
MTIDRLPERQLDFQLDVNSATWAELIQLPGVGPQLGKRIVDDRQTRGPFRKLDDLERVPGIGPKTLQEIAPHLIWPPSASASQPP